MRAHKVKSTLSWQKRVTILVAVQDNTGQQPPERLSSRVSEGPNFPILLPMYLLKCKSDVMWRDMTFQYHISNPNSFKCSQYNSSFKKRIPLWIKAVWLFRTGTTGLDQSWVVPRNKESGECHWWLALNLIHFKLFTCTFKYIEVWTTLDIKHLKLYTINIHILYTLQYLWL